MQSFEPGVLWVLAEPIRGGALSEVGCDWSLQEVLGSQSPFPPLYSLAAKLPTYALPHVSCHKFCLTSVPETTKPTEYRQSP